MRLTPDEEREAAQADTRAINYMARNPQAVTWTFRWCDTCQAKRAVHTGETPNCWKCNNPLQ
jgi:hypothetical protein